MIMKQKNNIVYSKILLVILSLFLTISTLNFNSYANIKTEEIISSAKAYCVFEGNTNSVIYAKNENQALPMASTTKILTAIVAIENYENIENLIIVSDSAVGIEGTSIYLKNNESIRFYDLLIGLMLASGNDCAVAIAEEVCGQEKFIQLMNELAISVGANNTNIVNVHGLDEKNHYTTAIDLAKITAYALKNNVFRKICSTKYAIIDETNTSGKRYLKHKDKLLFTMENCIGVKTGFTDNAGRCLVNAHEENGMQIISVLLNCGPMFEEAKKLTQLVLDRHIIKNFVAPYSFVGEVAVVDGDKNTLGVVTIKGFTALILKKDEELYRVEYDIPSKIIAPVVVDESIGKVRVFKNEGIVFEDDLYAIGESKNIDLKFLLENIFEHWEMF